MNKDKLIKAIIWASMFSFCVLLCAFFIYVGNNRSRDGSHLFIVIGYCLLPTVFICAYKALRNIIDSIFS